MNRDERRISELRQQLVGLLGAEAHLLPCGVIERMMRCGKPNCRCAAGPPHLHGPYYQWGYTKEGRSHARRLTETQFERYGPEIEQGRRLIRLLIELDSAEVSRVERAEGWGA